MKAIENKDGKTRCGWCVSELIYIKYHDEEWGREVKTDKKMFEF